MADLTNSSWSQTDSNNTQPAPSGFPSGILPSQIGGVFRATMGAVKRAYDHSNAMVTSTGSANAYVLTYEQPLQSGYVKGEKFLFFANHTNTGAATLNINGAGTRAILRADGSQVAAGEIVAGQVVTVVCDGVNFPAQSVATKDFKSSVSITLNSDAVIVLEDTGAPVNSFRRKMILSSRNVGGGSDWLFRQYRPSDGASEDFTLKSGTAGAIWTTGNFNPALKADLAGSTFTGGVYVAGVGVNGFEAGTGDGANYSTYNTKLRSHYGLALTTHDGTVNGIWDSRAGVLDVKGALRVNGQTAWHTGSFNPATKADLNTTPRFAGVLLGTGNGNIYSDPGAHNVVLRSGDGSGTPYKYAALQTDAFRTYSADILADGNLRTTADVIVGEGKTSSTIQMRDTDEGTRYVHNNSGSIGFLGSGGDWVFRVRDDGTVWTKQIGDLATRIDTIATAHGNRGRDEANANTAAYYATKTTPTVNGSVWVNGGTSYGSVQPALSLFNGGVEHWNIMAVNDGQLYFRNGDNGDVRMRLNRDGSLYLKQIGDVNTRIEDRANAWATARRDEAKTFATSEANRGRDEANNNTNANFFNKTTGAVQYVNSIPSFNASAIDIVRGNVLRARWTVDGNGTTILQNGDNGDNFFYVTTGGALWTKQFGDLYNHIENRSAAWARQESVARANERVAKGGDTMTGDLTVNKAYPTLNMLYGGVRHMGWQVREDAGTYLWDHSLGNWQMRVDTGGGVVARGPLYAGNGSATFNTNGDVYGAAWGNRWLSTRVNEVDGNANNRVAKTGDTMSGNLTIAKPNPGISLLYGGVYHGLLWVGNDAVFRYSNGDGAGDKFRVGPGGDIWCAQLGDINSRIEDRARAWAETRQPNLGFTPVRQGGGNYMGSNTVYIGWDGPASALRAQVDGVELERILTRNWVNPIIDVRLVYAGDLSNDWNKDQSYAEPYQGGVLTSRYVQSNQFIIDSWKGGRWRYLQKQDSYGNWYTVGYA
ncbi:hypothetical protein ACXIT0_11970 [Methylorubrum extorquens]